MAAHAGFAAAITIRENTLNGFVAASYANGIFGQNLSANLPGSNEDPNVKLSLFLGQPNISLEGSTNLIVIRLKTWGDIGVEIIEEEYNYVNVLIELELTIRPVFSSGRKLQLSVTGDDVSIREWNVTSLDESNFAPAIIYVRGEEFKERLLNGIILALAAGIIKLPEIDVNFLGGIATRTTSVEARIRNNSLLLGFNVDNDEFNIAGSIDELEDFAGEYEIAGVMNPDAMILFIGDLRDEITAKAEEQGATLTSLSAEAKDGYLFIRGRVAKSGGAINFSFHVKTAMYHTKPGAYFNYLPKDVRVHAKQYPALVFIPEQVETDIEREWWTVLFLEVIFGILSLGVTAIYFESLFNFAANNIEDAIRNGTNNNPPPRIIKNNPPVGGISTRVGLEQFDIQPSGIFIGVSFQYQLSDSKIHGPVIIPDDYLSHRLLYRFQLPSSIIEKDPNLYIQWSLRNSGNGTTLTNITNDVASSLLFEFSPGDYPTVRRFNLNARLFRQLGNVNTEISNITLSVSIREALEPESYIRWHSSVKNPQVKFDQEDNAWKYLGETHVHRWSEWHRLDKPCKSVHANNRYRHHIEKANLLPFSLDHLENHRKGLCPYCFYNGPAGINAEL